MTRRAAHIQTQPEGSRLLRYLAIERGSRPEGSHPAVQVLIQRPRRVGHGNRRLAEFLRIARGREV